MFDLYQEITDRIIAELENGVIPWHKGWTAGTSAAVSHTTGKAYSLLNQMLLGKEGEYITFKQCQAEGGKVRKGAKSKMVVFWKFIESDELDEVTGKPKQIPMLRYYNVFHIEDCEGIKAKFAGVLPTQSAEPDAQAESIIDSYLMRSGVKLIEMSGDRAFYSLLTQKDKLIQQKE